MAEGWGCYYCSIQPEKNKTAVAVSYTLIESVHAYCNITTTVSKSFIIFMPCILNILEEIVGGMQHKQFRLNAAIAQHCI